MLQTNRHLSTNLHTILDFFSKLLRQNTPRILRNLIFCIQFQNPNLKLCKINYDVGQSVSIFVWRNIENTCLSLRKLAVGKYQFEISPLDDPYEKSVSLLQNCSSNFILLYIDMFSAQIYYIAYAIYFFILLNRRRVCYSKLAQCNIQ